MPLTRRLHAEQIIRAQALMDNKRPRDAVPLIEEYLHTNPDSVHGWATLGTAALSLHDADLAERAFQEVLARAPEHAGALNGMANVCARRWELDAGEAYARRALELYPDLPGAFASFGAHIVRDGRFEEARELYERALELEPGGYQIQQGLGLIYMQLGRYTEGYKLRARPVWENPSQKPGRRLPIQTRDLTGRRVLLKQDEGNGDCVATARFIPMVKAMGGHVSMAARGPMRRLFQSIEAVDEVVEDTDAFETYDNMMTLISLPGYFRASPERLPPPIPMRAPAEARQRARKIVAPYSELFKVGFCWAGSHGFVMNYARSTTHHRFLDLAKLEGTTFFSLYKGELLQPYLDDPAARITVDASSSDTDYADAVGVMEEMDLIITTDTCVAHLAASLGKPTWILVHKVPYFYFSSDFGDRTPWYPSARLFRQTEHGNWDGVFARVKAALAQELAEWRSGARGAA
ncbi:MAG: tetratricopeptide repeat protein [Pseudomonadota bacterium]